MATHIIILLLYGRRRRGTSGYRLRSSQYYYAFYYFFSLQCVTTIINIYLIIILLLLSPFPLRPITAECCSRVIVGRRVPHANTRDSSGGQPVSCNRVRFRRRRTQCARVVVAQRWSSSKRVRRKSARAFYRTPFFLRHNLYLCIHNL